MAKAFPAMLLALVSAAPAWADKRLDEAIAKAEAQLAKGKDADAVKTLQKAASQAARDPEAQIALGALLLRVGQRDEARGAYAKARELAPAAAPVGARARTLAALSGYALRAGTLGEALRLARQAVEAEASGEALAALARAQARAGVPAARETAARASQTAPASSAAHLARGEALLAAHLASEAEPAFRRALELAPRSPLAGAGLGLSLARQGKLAEGLSAARAATQADAHSPEALVALGLAALAQDPVDKNNEAIAAVQQGSFLEPASPLVKLALGRVFESRGQLDQAEAAYAEAAGLDPSWAAPRVANLTLRFHKGDVSGALTGFRALAPELQEASEAQLLLGRLLLRKEDEAGAKKALDLALAGLPGLAEAQAAHGSAAYEVGELTLAADAYGRAAKLAPASLANASNYGLFLGYDGRLEEALAVLQALVARPGFADPGGFINLGWVYRSFKPARVAEAVAAYEKALKLDPKNGQAALGRALSYRAGRQWQKAIDAYDRAAKLDKKLNDEALLGTAWCFLSSGDTYKASFYTGLAVRAGADVKSLRAALTRAQQAPPKATRVVERDDDLPELVEELGSKNAGLQARAVKGLVAIGRPAVPYLASTLSRPTTSIAVREAIVDGLGRLGPAAAEALPHLDRLIKQGPPIPGSDDAPDEVARQLREARLLTTMQAAVGRIREK